MHRLRDCAGRALMANSRPNWAISDTSSPPSPAPSHPSSFPTLIPELTASTCRLPLLGHVAVNEGAEVALPLQAASMIPDAVKDGPAPMLSPGARVQNADLVLPCDDPVRNRGANIPDPGPTGLDGKDLALHPSASRHPSPLLLTAPSQMSRPQTEKQDAYGLDPYHNHPWKGTKPASLSLSSSPSTIFLPSGISRKPATTSLPFPNTRTETLDS